MLPSARNLDKLFEAGAAASSLSPNLYQDVQRYTGSLLAARRRTSRRFGQRLAGRKKFVESVAYDVRFPAG